MKSSRAFFAIAALAMLTYALGCGGGPEHEFGNVSGTVTLDGKPLADVAVTFKSESGIFASGQADASGKFTLMSATGDQGAVVGQHTVTVSPSMAAGIGGSSADGGEATGKRQEIPAKYQDMIQSDLTATISPGDNSVALELKSR